jgi:primase-polymerase (primpol)-like protein
MTLTTASGWGPIAPRAFEPYKQFLLYKMIPQPDGKIKKLPINPHNMQSYPKGADWQRTSTSFTDMHTATILAKTAGPSYGVGFLFTPDDPFFFVDIDHALQGDKWSERSQELLGWFSGCAVEVSCSGTGLHIFGSGEWPEQRKCKSFDNTFDIYTEWRFVALTGTHASGDASVGVRDDVRELICSTFLKADSTADSLGWTTEPVPEYKHLPDDLLLAKAQRSGGVAGLFEGKATFNDLWERNEKALAKSYPPENTDYGPYDDSAADMALAQHLAFWTGRNCERIQELMMQSELRREKWDRDSYMTATIEKAVARQSDVYRGPDNRRIEQLQENVAIGEDTGVSMHTPLMTLPEMLERLVFIGGEHAVGHLDTKVFRKKPTAADEYAASRHEYVDPHTRAEKSMQAFKAWIEHPQRKSCESITWRPLAGDFTAPPEGHGLAFNGWRGFRPLAVPGDWFDRIGPWLEHVGWLCGDQTSDFMLWLAHIVQHPDVLPHTCYLHVTPTTGIGRNWMAGVLCRVLRGYVAAGVDLGKILDGKFNGRLSQKLLGVVDEVREGGTVAQQHQRAERFKSIINEENREIDHKYGAQCIEYNCCRWLMFSQHYDALPFENNDRRVIVVSNPTKRQSPEYYAELYGRLKDEKFIASVWEYLRTLDISGFNPGRPAPLSEAKRFALETMGSDVDFAAEELKQQWPGDIATLSQFEDLFAPGPIKGSHAVHALRRAGMEVLAKRANLPNGRKSRIIVVRGNRAEADARKDAAAACSASEIEWRMTQP